MIRKLFAGVFAAALVGGFALAADLKSGPQAGAKLPGPFHPLNATGEDAGKKACLYCKFGDDPVAMVFARSADCPQTAKLIKKLDEVTGANKKADMGGFVVFLSDSDKLADTLKAMAEKEKLKNVILAVDNPAGPDKYDVAKDADLTVVLYTDRTVKVNYAFKKGEIKDSDIDAIIKNVSKIIPEKK
jgi:hypothetical protein